MFMKTKSLLLAFAGLGLFACTNEDVTKEQFPDGNGVVAVKIVTPETITRAMPTDLPDGTARGPVKVVGDITVELVAEEGGAKHVLNANEIQNGATTVKFWNVKKPSKVKVYMNGAPEDGSYNNVEILDLQVAPASIAAYGEAVPTLTPNSESPEADTEVVKNEGNKPEDANKKYQMYTANVTMKIPVARLEISGIRHNQPASGSSCEYKTLTIDGIYLDNIKPTGNGTIDDYKFKGDGAGTGDDAILSYAIPNGDKNFMEFDNVWPSGNKVYAFNFYPGGSEAENPQLKIYFATAVAADGAEPKSSPRYAMITKYVAAGGNAESEGIVLEAGKVYRITNAVLDDKNIIGDEGGNTLYGVTVTVEEASWTVETINGIWKE